MTYWLWIYNLPNWLFDVISVLVFCSFGITGLTITRRWVPSLHHAIVSYNDIVGYYFGAITLLYGIPLGLLLIGVWSTFTETEAKVDREATLWRPFTSMSATTRNRVAGACKKTCAVTPSR